MFYWDWALVKLILVFLMVLHLSEFIGHKFFQRHRLIFGLVMTLLQGLVMALLFYLLVMVTGHYVWEHSLRLLLVFLVLALLRLYIFLKKKREFLPG